MSIGLKKTLLFAAIDIPILFYGYETYGHTWSIFFATFAISMGIYLPLVYFIWDRHNKETVTS